jgi:hypothetical protein
MDESRTRLVLATVPGFDMKQVWFATGAEYWNSGTCLDGRDIEIFTKPELSSTGIWRGKKLYVSQPTLDSKTKCADPDAFRFDPNFTVTTVTFTDPDKLQLDEAWDGQEPGLFEVRGNIGDDELRKIAMTMEQIQRCLEKQATCSYPIESQGRMHWPANLLNSAITTDHLLTLDEENSNETGTTCYSMVLQADWYGAAFGMNICYRGDMVTGADVGGEVIE